MALRTITVSTAFHRWTQIGSRNGRVCVVVLGGPDLESRCAHLLFLQPARVRLVAVDGYHSWRRIGVGGGGVGSGSLQSEEVGSCTIPAAVVRRNLQTPDEQPSTPAHECCPPWSAPLLAPEGPTLQCVSSREIRHRWHAGVVMAVEHRSRQSGDLQVRVDGSPSSLRRVVALAVCWVACSATEDEVMTHLECEWRGQLRPILSALAMDPRWGDLALGARAGADSDTRWDTETRGRDTPHRSPPSAVERSASFDHSNSTVKGPRAVPASEIVVPMLQRRFLSR